MAVLVIESCRDSRYGHVDHRQRHKNSLW